MQRWRRVSLGVLALAASVFAPDVSAQRRRRTPVEPPPPIARIYAVGLDAAVVWTSPLGVRIQPLDPMFVPLGSSIPIGVALRTLVPRRRGARGCRDALVVRDLFLARDLGHWALGVVQQREPCARPGETPAPGTFTLTLWTEHDGRFTPLPDALAASAIEPARDSSGVGIALVDARDELVYLRPNASYGTVALQNYLRLERGEHPELAGLADDAVLLSAGRAEVEHWYEVAHSGLVRGEVPVVGSPGHCVATASDWACANEGNADVMFVPRAGNAGLPARVHTAGAGTLVPAGGTSVLRVMEIDGGSAFQQLDRSGARSVVTRLEGLRGADVRAIEGRGFLAAGVSARGQVEVRVIPVPAIEGAPGGH